VRERVFESESERHRERDGEGGRERIRIETARPCAYWEVRVLHYVAVRCAYRKVGDNLVVRQEVCEVLVNQLVAVAQLVVCCTHTHTY